ncbi:MAG: NADH-quinone oxidoreductase subunit N [Chthoniobacterales bacterium]|nr:NADH-quinone oxidoreductase subunit N [Chthoniobacterales bacterium]
MSWWVPLLPEALLVFFGIVLLGLGIPAQIPRWIISATAFVAILGANALIGIFPLEGEWLRGAILLTPATHVGRLFILLLAAIFLLLAHSTLQATKHFAELIGLGLFAVAGMLFLAAAGDLLTLFVGLELAGLPIYALAAWNKSEGRGAEAALKLFLSGGISAAIMVYGMSLLFGAAGGLSFRMLANAEFDPLLLLGTFLVLAGFSFKLAAFPFHLWAPDVYEGTPTAIAALIATGSKIAAVFALTKLVAFVFQPWNHDWGITAIQICFAFLGSASVVFGNLGALNQKNAKRLLAYSAIAQSGYLLIGLAGGKNGISAAQFFVIVYALAVAAAFAAIVLAENSHKNANFDAFYGFCQKDPVASTALLLSLISLAGIPPLAGFLGKFWLFAAAFESPWLRWLVALAIGFNAVSLYYYLQLAKAAFLTPRAESQNVPPPGTFMVRCLALALSLSVLILGLNPSLLSFLLKL